MRIGGGVLAVILILVWYGFWLAQPVNMVTADLGRHIQNGHLLLADWSTNAGVLDTNFYSYTHVDFPVVNHHWGSGVLAALLEQAGGITAVQVGYIVISLLSLLIVFDLARRWSNLLIATLTALALVPLLAQRTEVRPEAFSYLFIACFIWILWRVTRGDLSWRWLWALPVLQLLWVNTHVYFVFGIFIIGLYLLEQLVYRWPNWREVWRDVVIRRLAAATGLVVLASLMTPFGIRGLLYPFQIFRNYGYQLIENQSIFFLEEWGFDNPNFLLVKILTTVLLVGFAIAGASRRQQRLPLAHIALTATLVVMAWLALRNFTPAGLVAIPMVAFFFSAAASFERRRFTENTPWYTAGVGAVLLIIIFFTQLPDVQERIPVRGFGLVPGVGSAAQFMRDNKIAGPIMNNYDIGGYLIYFLPPEQQVFVDNRPEAYPESFFTNVYIPMQEDEAVWEQQLAEHNFNVIVFRYRDITPWAQTFLAARVGDREWVPVFADPQVLIWVRDVPENAAVIEAHSIDRRRLRIGG